MRANGGIEACVCVHMQKMEQGFRWEFVTRKTRINELNEKRSLITWG